MSLHTCDGTLEGDMGCFVCGPMLRAKYKIEALEQKLIVAEEQNQKFREALDRIGFGPYPIGMTEGWYSMYARRILSDLSCSGKT